MSHVPIFFPTSVAAAFFPGEHPWYGRSPLITTAHTHLCDDELFCHPVQSSKLSFESPPSYGISFAFFPNPPSPPFTPKLLLLELLSCTNRYNLRRLSVLRWDLPLRIAVMRAEDKELSHDAPCHTRCRDCVVILSGSWTPSSVPEI